MPMTKSYNDYLRDIIAFNGDKNVVALRERFSTASFFEIISKERSETTYSAFLKWLFTENGIVNETSPIFYLLDVLVQRCEEQNNVDTILRNNEVKKCFVTRKLLINSINAETEKPIRDLAQRITSGQGAEELNDNDTQTIAEKSRDRIDLYFDCDIKGSGLSANRLEIIIENKVDSSEGGKKENKINVKEYDDASQTKRYYLGTWFKRDDAFQLYVFLTPKEPGKVSDIDSHFIKISYQDIVDFVLLPMLASSSLSPRNRFFLEEFLNQLIYPSLDGVFLKPSIANGARYTKQFDKVWEDHQDLVIDAAIAAAESDLWILRDDQHPDPKSTTHYYDKQPRNEIYTLLKDKSVPYNEVFTQTGWAGKPRFTKIQKLAKNNNVYTDQVKQGFNDGCRELLSSFWDKNKRLLTAVIKGMKEDESVKYEALLSSVSKRDNTHYIFNGTEYKGKNALVRPILSYLLIIFNNGIDDINKVWKDYLQDKCKGNIGDFPSSQQWTVNKYYDGLDDGRIKGLNEVLKKELKLLKKQGVFLLYDKKGFEDTQKQIKESKRKKDLSHDYALSDSFYYYNQWGWGNIDYFIGFYRTIANSSKNGSNPIIELTWPTTD